MHFVKINAEILIEQKYSIEQKKCFLFNKTLEFEHLHLRE